MYGKGVWDRDDQLLLNVYDSDSGSDSVARSSAHMHSGSLVALTTIDKIGAELGLSRVDFIKMDIEGSERRALKGARETVARWRPRMAISVEHAPDDAEAIPRQIRAQWPNLSLECGPCAPVKTDYVQRLQPWVVFAW